MKVKGQIQIGGSINLPVTSGSITALQEISAILERTLTHGEVVGQFNEWLEDGEQTTPLDSSFLPLAWANTLQDIVHGTALRLQDVVDSVREQAPIKDPLELLSTPQIKTLLYFAFRGTRDRTLEDIHENLARLNILVVSVSDSNYNQALTSLHDTPKIFGERNRKIFLEYIHSVIIESLEVNQISTVALSLKNSTDLELIIRHLPLKNGPKRQLKERGPKSLRQHGRQFQFHPQPVPVGWNIEWISPPLTDPGLICPTKTEIELLLDLTYKVMGGRAIQSIPIQMILLEIWYKILLYPFPTHS